MKSILCALALVFCVRLTAADPVSATEREALSVGIEAYTYLYPLVTMDVTRRQLTNIEAGKMVGRGPMNTLSHIRAFPTAEFKEVVRPNFDTLYSSGWLDLTKEPLVITAPDTQGRYYLLPLLDMWTDVFAAPGSRTSGTKAGRFLLVGPGWRGKVPAGMERIDSPTPYVWLIGRTQTNGPKDYEAVHKVQDGYEVTPLSQFGKAKKAAAVKIDPSVDMKTPPLDQVNGLSSSQFFRYAAELLKKHPPHVSDWSVVARMKRIGLVPGKAFPAAPLSAEVERGLDQAPAAALKLMKEKLPTLARVVNGWQMNTDTMGVYGDFYLKRAIVSMVGLGANQPEDAIYPLAVADENGETLKGENDYVLHFAKEELPPVSAFWSVTMYDQAGFQTANVLNRFAIGDRDNLKYNGDGSLDLYLQNESPGKDLESNWLPAPKGTLGVTMRLYGPKQEALDGRWNPPKLKVRVSRNT